MLLPLAACIRETAEYCASRQAFGRPLLANQSIHFTLAELWTELELLRAGIYQVHHSITHRTTELEHDNTECRRRTSWRPART